MKALASSSSSTRGEGQHAGAHSGLTHPGASPQDAAPSADSGKDTGEALRPCPHGCPRPDAHTHLAGDESVTFGPAERVAPPVAPLSVHDDDSGGYRILDVNGLVVAKGLTGWNSAVAISRILEQAIEGAGLCLVHLMELDGFARCWSCRMGARRSDFSAVPR